MWQQLSKNMSSNCASFPGKCTACFSPTGRQLVTYGMFDKYYKQITACEMYSLLFKFLHSTWTIMNESTSKTLSGMRPRSGFLVSALTALPNLVHRHVSAMCPPCVWTSRAAKPCPPRVRHVSALRPPWVRLFFFVGLCLGQWFGFGWVFVSCVSSLWSLHRSLYWVWLCLCPLFVWSPLAGGAFVCLEGLPRICAQSFGFPRMVCLRFVYVFLRPDASVELSVLV